MSEAGGLGRVRCWWLTIGCAQLSRITNITPGLALNYNFFLIFYNVRPKLNIPGTFESTKLAPSKGSGRGKSNMAN